MVATLLGGGLAGSSLGSSFGIEGMEESYSFFNVVDCPRRGSAQAGTGAPVANI